MAETGYYDSPLTGEELDAAFRKMATIDQSVTQAGQSAEQARGYAASIDPDSFAKKSDLDSYYTKDQADSAFAPTNHASTDWSKYGMASGTRYGHVVLSDTPGDAGAGHGIAATPKCVQDAIAPQQITPTFQAGFSDAGATRIYKCGNVVVCTFHITIGSHEQGWNDVCAISAMPPATVYGRTLVSGHSADFAIRSSDGLFRVYLQSSDSGGIYLSVCYVTV